MVTVPGAMVACARPVELPVCFWLSPGWRPLTPVLEAEKLKPQYDAFQLIELARFCVTSAPVVRLFFDASAVLASAAPVSVVVPPTATA